VTHAPAEHEPVVELLELVALLGIVEEVDPALTSVEDAPGWSPQALACVSPERTVSTEVRSGVR
jgi:hypothetical protein